MKTLSEALSLIFRQIESDRGTSSLSKYVLEALISSLNGFEAGSVEDFYKELRELIVLLKGTKPRMGVVIAHFCQIWDVLEERKSKIKSMEDLKMVLIKTVDSLNEEANQDAKQIISNGVDCVEDGDSILIHSHSRTVMNILAKAFRAKKKIRVVLAEQEEDKTQDMIHFFQERGIPFVVVPEYMLSHIETEVTKVFLGGITFNNQYVFVTDAGTNSVVSEFHHAHIPIFMFMSTKKFSLWDVTSKEMTYKITQKQTEKHPEKFVTYERIKFSHDRVPVELVDFVVTEEGKATPAQLKKNFDAKYKSYSEWRERHFSKGQVEDSVD